MKNLILLLVLSLIVGGCAESVPVDIPEGYELYDFWDGLVHGWVYAFAFWGKVFGYDVSLYGVNNVGIWYDAGFFLGIGSLVQTASKVAKGKKR